MIRINSPQTLGSALKTARKHLRLTQSDLALAAGVGLRFIVDLEAGKPTVRLAHVLRVIDALGGGVLLEGLAEESEDRLLSSEDADHAT
jgi:HTH-type transcriptional regulator / antitoxin HipB